MLYLVLINWRNGRRYQHVLALCAFLTGVILKGLTLRKLVPVCVRTFYVCEAISFVDWLDIGFMYIIMSMHVLCLWSDWFCGLTRHIYIYEKSFDMCICLWPEFDCPGVTLCGWQEIKIQLLTLKRRTVNWMDSTDQKSCPGIHFYACMCINLCGVCFVQR